MFSLRPSVSARALSWRFLFLFVKVQARNNSEKQEASAVLFPSWSPATRGKTNKKTPTKAGMCHYFVQVETFELNAVMLPASGRRSTYHQGHLLPWGWHSPYTTAGALHPHHQRLLRKEPQPGTAQFCCQMLLHHLQEK